MIRSAVAMMALMVCGLATAAELHVPSQYVTIQDAIDAASNGDEIPVAPGTYTGTGDEVVNTLGKAITIRASGTPEQTIIDGQSARRGITCDTGEGADTIIEGFTITGGNTSSAGGGIYCSSSSPTITDCTIMENAAEYGGGIVCNNNSNPTITDCTIEGNMANFFGGGIYSNSSNSYITNCTILSNSALSQDGGGIYCTYDSNLTITNCTISGNTAVGGGGEGGGISCYESSPTISGCTITDNTAAGDGGGIYSSNNSSPTLRDGSIVCENSPDQIYGHWVGFGDIWVHEVCPEEEGACCMDQFCTYDTATVCALLGGNYLGDGSTCDDFSCFGGSPTGACCSGHPFFCVSIVETDCLQWGGQWLGEATFCDDCPPPVDPEVLGACCINGGCVPSTAEGCFEGGGSYAGDDVACADADCLEDCPGDLTGDNQVTIMDLLFVLDAWGACP